MDSMAKAKVQKSKLKKWVSPVIKTERMSVRSLLGENGWSSQLKNIVAVIVPT